MQYVNWYIHFYNQINSLSSAMLLRNTMDIYKYDANSASGVAQISPTFLVVVPIWGGRESSW